MKVVSARSRGRFLLWFPGGNEDKDRRLDFDGPRQKARAAAIEKISVGDGAELMSMLSLDAVAENLVWLDEVISTACSLSMMSGVASAIFCKRLSRQQIKACTPTAWHRITTGLRWQRRGYPLRHFKTAFRLGKRADRSNGTQ